MDYLASEPQFNTLSLLDLLRARDQFHPHLLHKANVVGTAIGRYRIRKDDPYPGKRGAPASDKQQAKPARTLENSEVRDYSWPAVLVFVSKWVDKDRFGNKNGPSAADFIPSTIYLDDGRSAPICVVEAPLAGAPVPAPALEGFEFPAGQIAGGYPVLSTVQQVERIASLGCLVTDGHRLYALTNRHVAGQPGEPLYTHFGAKPASQSKLVQIGNSSTKQIGRLPFEKLYDSWPGKHIYVNLDVGLIDIVDQRQWNPSVYGVGALGPLADLSVENLTLNLIGCPVRASGCASGRLAGEVSALFYRYQSVGGFEFVADFLIGPRGDSPLLTRPGDSGTVWVIDTPALQPLAVQWGGTVFASETQPQPFALATNLSNVCRELEVELYRGQDGSHFEYWEAVGHYAIGSYACTQPQDPQLRQLMLANRANVGFEPAQINTSVNNVKAPGFVPLADVPDRVWKPNTHDPAPYRRSNNENATHYADLDIANQQDETLDNLTPDAPSLRTQVWRGFYDSIGWTGVTQRGILPFRVWQIYKQMVVYVGARDVPHFVAAAGVLAHYVGDACQPLHGSYLNNGDPFRYPDGTTTHDVMLGHADDCYGQGVHTAYEGTMLNAKYKELLQGLTAALAQPHQMPLIRGGQEAGFATIGLMRRTQAALAPMEIVEVFAQHTGVASAELWKAFGQRTIQVIADGCRTLAMLWDSAWQEGGGSQIPAAALATQSPGSLRDIYNDHNFLPSIVLGKSAAGNVIDKYL